MSRATGLSRTTIKVGLKELAQGADGKTGPTSSSPRIRRLGGGRKTITENDPKVIDDLELLISHEVMVQLIGSTTTKKGLKIKARLDKSDYPKGKKLSHNSVAIQSRKTVSDATRRIQSVCLRTGTWHSTKSFFKTPRATGSRNRTIFEPFIIAIITNT